MSDFIELAEQYIAAWNETDPSARRALINEIWSEDGRYIDPLAQVAGREQVDAVIAAAQAQFAGLTFRLASAGFPRQGAVSLISFPAGPGAVP
jgi:hypothetical protein